MKLLFLPLTLGVVSVFATVARAQTFPATVIKGPDYPLSARAYFDTSRLPDSKYNPASRYDLRLNTAPMALRIVKRSSKPHSVPHCTNTPPKRKESPSKTST